MRRAKSMPKMEDEEVFIILIMIIIIIIMIIMIIIITIIIIIPYNVQIFYQEPNKDASIKLPFGSPSIKPPSLLYQPPPVAPSLLPPPQLPSPKNPSDPLRSMPIYSDDPPTSNLMEPNGSGLLATTNPPTLRSTNLSQPGETQLHRPTRPISPARPTPPTRHSVHARPSAHVRPGRTETFEQPETEISGDSPRRRKRLY